MAQSSLTIAGRLADTLGQGEAQSVLGMAQLIAESARNAKFNRDAVLQLSRRVDELATVISVELEGSHALASDFCVALQNFRAALYDIDAALQEHARRGYLSQLLFQERDAVQLRGLTERVNNLFAVLMVHAQASSIRMAATVYEPLENSPVLERLDEVAAFLAPQRDLSTKLFLQVPPQPRLFGRTRELESIVDTLCAHDAARIAVLGGPGMGKTSLAVTAMHHASIAGRFAERRYFVACDAADDAGFLSTLCAAFGITAVKKEQTERRLVAVLSATPALLVLDNLESAWEAAHNRIVTEAVLALLSHISTLSLIVTIRGSERPSGVAWTRPLAPPLLPLDDGAAKQMFLAISDSDEAHPALSDLLEHLGSIPLAVMLMANLAQYESLDSLLVRWDSAGTAMLQRAEGRHRLSNADTSIALSLLSPRMQQESSALALLGLLSLIPRGIVESDIQLWASIPNCRTALSVLVQTALVVRTADDRVRVLAPIRDYVLENHPPSSAHSAPLYRYYFHLADLLWQDGKIRLSPQAISAMAPELDNIESIIRRALRSDTNSREAIVASIRLCRLFNVTGMGSPGILHAALAAAQSYGFQDLVADLKFHWGDMASRGVIAGTSRTLWEEARAAYAALGDVRGLIDSNLRLASFGTWDHAAQVYRDMRDMAEALQDLGRVANCTRYLADVLDRMGRSDEAVELYRTAVSIAQAQPRPDLRVIGLCIFEMADVEQSRGNVTTGIAGFLNALAAFAEAHETRMLGLTHYMLGQLSADCGDWEAAIQHHQLALPYLRMAQSTAQEFTCLSDLVQANLAVGHEKAALEQLHIADRLLLTHAFMQELETDTVLRAHSSVALWRGDVAGARAALQAALISGTGASLRPHTSLLVQATLLESLGVVERRDNKFDEAQAYFIVALLMHHKLANRTRTARALARLAEVVDDEVSGVIVRAVMLPLHRFGYRPTLADCLLHSAKIADRQGDQNLSRHRAGNALRYSRAMQDVRRSELATAFLHDLASRDGLPHEVDADL